MVDNQEVDFSLDMPLSREGDSSSLDQDRNQTVSTASARIITAVIGSGTLSLAWAAAQLGWIGGAVVIVLFSALCCVSSSLLASCYCSAASATGRVNHTYMDAVKNILGGAKFKLYVYIQYVNIFGLVVGYGIASAISMRAIMNQNRIQTSEGKKSPDRMNINRYIITFGIFQILASQAPGFRDFAWVSVISAVIHVLYSLICIGLGITNIIGNGCIKGVFSVTGRSDREKGQKFWRCLEAIAEFANAYTTPNLIFEIQNMFKLPSADTMKQASIVSVGLTTSYVMLCASVGYGAFGELSPSYLLTGFGIDSPYWLIDLANAAVVLHLLGDYQACCRPIFALIEKQALLLFPSSDFIARDIKIRIMGFELVSFNRFRLVSRTLFVIITTMTSLLFPFFDDVIGLVGGLGFWPLMVYFPVEMYMKQNNIVRWSSMWFLLQLFSLISLVVSMVAVAGSVAGFAYDLKP